jgi:hypothetical protein
LSLVNRTFAHDEMVALADARQLPDDQTYRWIPRQHDGELRFVDQTSAGARRDSDPRGVIPMLGTLTASASWDATSPKARKRAAALQPIEAHTWNAELTVQSGQTIVQIGRGGAGFMVSGEAEPITIETPMVSLLDTPYPDEEPETPIV